MTISKRIKVRLFILNSYFKKPRFGTLTFFTKKFSVGIFVFAYCLFSFAVFVSNETRRTTIIQLFMQTLIHVLHYLQK